MIRDEQLIRAALEMAAEVEFGFDDGISAEWRPYTEEHVRNSIRSIDPAEVLAKVPPAWQPIETAPKDGTIMDVWLGGCEEWDRQFYCDGSSRRSPAWAWKGGKFRPCTGLPGIQTVFVQPTHWMPLPTPPQEAPNDRT